MNTFFLIKEIKEKNKLDTIFMIKKEIYPEYYSCKITNRNIKKRFGVRMT